MKKHLIASKEVITLQIFRFFSSVLFFFLIQVKTFSQERIIGGTPIDISDRPFQVSIEQVGDHKCSGVILNEEWVLTAGHCFNLNVPAASEHTVHAGATDQTDNGEGQRVGIAQVIFHPLWIEAGAHVEYGPDLALIRLKTPLCFNANVQSIAYATSMDNLEAGTIASLSGWGAITHGGESQAELRGVDLPIISDEEANSLLNGSGNECPPIMNNNVNNDYIAFFDGAGKSAAQGDSGGPATINGGTLLIGVASWGGCPRDEFPSVYTDIRSFTDFIETHINQPGGTDKNINENTTIDTDQDFHGNIIVKEGSELTITATVRFTEGHGINVERGAKLHLNGGTLTRHCSAPDWKGVNVEGYSGLAQPSSPFTMPSANQAGVVLLTKNSQGVPATIEWARNAISTTKFSQSWNSAYWGGLVHCENSQFLNCRRAAEFMKYDLYNRSKFVNCTFTDDIPGEANNLGAVSIWDTEPILFDHCTFGYMDNYAILAYDAACTVKNGNTFKGNNRAIQYFATVPVSGGEIMRIEPLGGAPNVFENNDWLDIELHSSSFFKNTRIIGNQFKGTYDGIWIDGHNSANIRNNYFSDKDFAISGQFTANGSNYIYCNDISNDILLPILFEGNNHRTRFLKNLLESELVDVAVTESSSGVPGSLHPSQGSGGYPAHNCFSIINQEHIWTLGQTVSFNYYLPYNPQSCETPQPSSNGPDNYNLIPTNEPIFEDCPLLDDDEEESYVYTDYTDVKQQYLALKAQLNSDPNNTQLLNQALQKEEEKENIVAWFVRDAINNGNVSITETILTEEGTDNANRLRYGLRVQLNDYAGAHSILNTLPSLTQDEQWFKSVQEINLERLQNPLNFILSASQDSLLNEVAFSQSSERGYARALLSFLKGTQFSPDFEVPQRNRNSRPNPPSLIKKDLDKVSIHPNPANSQVEVVLADVQTITTAIISGLDGEILRTFQFDNSTNRFNIPLEGLPTGMYFLQIKSPEKVIGRTRLVISR